jgi:hypothetical protein
VIEIKYWSNSAPTVRDRLASSLGMTTASTSRWQSGHVTPSRMVFGPTGCYVNDMATEGEGLLRECSGQDKRFRMAVARVGFKRAWQDRNHGTILAAAELSPDSIAREAPKRFMWHDQAGTRRGEWPCA